LKQNKKILIVEDDWFIAQDTKKRLEELGYLVSAILPSGEEAIEKVEKEHFDLILMDIMLKGQIDGVEAAGKINTIRNIPIIYMTAFADKNLIERVKTTVPYGYITKPFKEEALHTAVEVAFYKHEMERKLRESEEKFRAFVTNTQEIAFMLDEKGICLLSEGKGLSALGLEPGEAVGKSAFELYKEYPDLISYIKRALAGEVITVELFVEGNYFNNQYTPNLNYKGEVKGMLGFSVNITREKKAEQKLKAAHENLEEIVKQRTKELAQKNEELKEEIVERLKVDAEKEKLERQLQQSQKMESVGLLAGGIAHDFNNILVPVLGYSEMILLSGIEASPFREKLLEIHDGALRAKELVKQILTFSRQKSQEFKIMKIQPIIKEVLKFIRSSIPTSIEIKQNISTDCGIIKADPTQIHQIVMNLSTNAYHAMEDTGGQMTVSLKQVQLNDYDSRISEVVPGAYVCLSIKDTGRGMDDNVMTKAFDPFFTTKEQGKGTGMGLSVVHGIVKSMGGAIQIKSKLDKGTTVNVYFHLVENTIEPHMEITKKPIIGGTEHILIVDDEETVIKTQLEMLKGSEYTVSTTTDSNLALKTFRANPKTFDLVITDLTMPSMTGDTLAGSSIKIRPDIPILLCTGFNETISESQAAQIGIKGILTKPFVTKDFFQKIREVLDNMQTEE
jgi:PAS domain S-box-containing protein